MLTHHSRPLFAALLLAPPSPAAPHLPPPPLQIEITAKIFRKSDEDGTPLVEKILDKTGMKGTGRWTIQEAAERSVAAPTMTAALDARYLSGLKVCVAAGRARVGWGGAAGDWGGGWGGS